MKKLGNRLSVLIVDSEDEDRNWISDALKEMGLSAIPVPDGPHALKQLRDTPYELVIVDVDLQRAGDGLRVAKAAKWRWPKTSVILTARRPTLQTAIAGIDLGVDGYLLKPASVDEIVEEIETALERQRQRCCVEDERHLLQWGSLLLDKESRSVSVDEEAVHLTPTEFDMLRHLMENAYRVISPEELVEVARGDTRSAQDAADVARWHIHNLRQKIEVDPHHPRYVINVHGVGYTFARSDSP